MVPENDKLPDEIGRILHMADMALSSAHPWRAEYLKRMADRARELISAGHIRAATELLDRLKRALEQWDLNEPDRKIERSDIACNTAQTVQSEVEDNIVEYLKIQKEQYANVCKDNQTLSQLCKANIAGSDTRPKESEEVWNVYRQWSLLETEAWDLLCSEALVRIRVSQYLDFSDHLSEAWGPYNTKYNIIEALKRLNAFDQTWLESYLILYESLQQIENNL